MKKRTDNPCRAEFKLSAHAVRLVDVLALRLGAEDGDRTVSRTEVVEKAVRLLAKKKKIVFTS